jgi:hypothetical protein
MSGFQVAVGVAKGAIGGRLVSPLVNGEIRPPILLAERAAPTLHPSTFRATPITIGEYIEANGDLLLPLDKRLVSTLAVTQ